MELKFLPLRAEILHVQALRIVDLDRERQKQGTDKGEEQVLGTQEGTSGESELVAKEPRTEKVWVDVPSGMLPDVVVEQGDGHEKREEHENGDEET